MPVNKALAAVATLAAHSCVGVIANEDGQPYTLQWDKPQLNDRNQIKERRLTDNENTWDVKNCIAGDDFYSSEFGKVACEYAKNGRHQANCLPRLHEPPQDVKITGAVLLLHGYTACPDQVMDLADRLASEGAVVFTPLIVGHGLEYNSEECASGKCTGNDNHLDLPVSSIDYFEFASKTYQNFRHDIRKYGKLDHVGILGLSVGAAITAQIMSIDGISDERIFTRGIIGSPFLTLDNGQLQLFKGNGVNFAELSKKKEDISMYSGGGFLQAPYGWGAGCEVERNNGRGGYCNFQLANLGAVHAFATNIFGRPGQIKAPLDAILVERDGSFRNAVVAKLLRGTKSDQKSICLFPKEPSSCVDNTCSVPHSNLARAEALIGGPHAMWWEPELHQQIVDSLMKDIAVGTTHSDIAELKTPKKDICYHVDLEKLPGQFFQALK